MNIVVYFGNAIMDLWEAIMGVKRQLAKSYKLAFGGLIYLRMQMSMWRVAMYAREMENHLGWMSCLYIQSRQSNLLRSGLLISMDLLAHLLDIPKHVRISQQPIISQDGKKQHQLRIVPWTQQFVSIVHKSLLGLTTIGVWQVIRVTIFLAPPS